MRFDASQHMKLGQHMKLAPRMIQSMEILQMPLMQLEERIAQELEGNVTLEAVDNEPDELAQSLGDAASDTDTDLDGVPETDGDQDDAGSDFADDIGGADEARSDDERPLDVDNTHSEADFDRLDSYSDENPDAVENEHSERPDTREYDLSDRRVATRLEGEPDAKSEAMANTEGRGESLVEQLQKQWHLADVDQTTRDLGEMVISYIEDDGYLRVTPEAMIDRLPADQQRPTPERVVRAIKAVQILLDPPGVAARDTRECLLLQTDASLEQPAMSTEDRASWGIVRRLIAEHLEDLAQNRLPKIAERTGLSISEIKLAMEKMRHLNLAPARQLVRESTGMIVPDAIVEYDADQDRYVAYLNDMRLPNLRINQEYALLARDKEAPKPTREFLKKNLTNAAWLIDAVEQRRRTLLRVIRVVVDAQREYFDYGPQALRPLPMTQVAEQLGVHVATVSRTVADKHLMTPRGVVALRGFFSGGTQTDSGEEMSWDAVKAALKEVIDAEDKNEPLSDDALAAELSKRGIEIARRTVAKYRDQLNIAPARLRKQF